MRKIPIEGEVVMNYDMLLGEKEFGKMLDDIQTLLALVQSTDSILRNMVEKSPPIFSTILKKFLILNLAQNESLLELQKWSNEILAELWALKFGGKEGEA